MLRHLLREEAIKIGFEALDREDAFKKLIALIPAWSVKSQDRRKIFELLMNREKIGTTAMGEGICLPNCILGGVSVPLAVLGISRAGVAFPSLDGEPVHIFFLLVLPASEDAGQMKARILHEAEGLFKDRFLRERLKIAESPEEAFEVILRESENMTAASLSIR